MARIDGTKGADSLTGTGGDDQIFGYDGDDVLDGGAGADAMEGGAGADTYHVDDSGDSVTEAADGGRDVIRTSLNHMTLAANVEDLVYVGAATTGFTGSGNALANSIWGGAGMDVLDGGAGADILRGLGNDDLYIVDNSADQVTESAGEGTDTVHTSLVFYIVPENVEGLVFTGQHGGRVAYGNAGANRIVGAEGDDFLDGGGGVDLLIGGVGDDHYVVDQAGDQIQEQDGGGIDTISARLPEYALPAFVEKLVYAGDPAQGFYGLGNALANLLVGGNGDDVLWGGAGADQMKGLGGDDRYDVDDALDSVVEEAGGGTDRVLTTLRNYTLPANVEVLLYNGESEDGFTGTGNAAANVIHGSLGADMLDGKAGADTLHGHDGNDEYWVDDLGDTIVEIEGEGRDAVYVSAVTAFTLAAHVEDLRYHNLQGGTLTGNAADNSIFGHSGNDSLHGKDGMDVLLGLGGDDLLDGGTGADDLQGGEGNDVYLVDHASDKVSEVLHGGTDEVRTALGSRSDFAQMYVLPVEVENLTGTSATGQGVYGNASDNLIRMGAGSDLVVLHDGGVDTVEGGAGDDFFYYGGAFTAADRTDGGAGYDAVGLLGNYALTLSATSLIGIEKLAVYSSGGAGSNHYAITTVNANVAAGKELMVVGLSLLAGETLFFDGSAETEGRFNIRGGRGSDTLSGGAGADALYGNLGSDDLRGGAGNDFFEYLQAAESAPGTRDRILDFAAGDKISLINIDADGNAANGNSRFKYIGEAAFSNVAGQLRVTRSGADWVVEGDVNGDGFADLVILVNTPGGHVLGAGDFWL